MFLNPLNSPTIIFGTANIKLGIFLISAFANAIINFGPTLCNFKSISGLNNFVTKATIKSGIIAIKSGKASNIPSANANNKSIPAIIISGKCSINVVSIVSMHCTIAGIKLGMASVIPFTNSNNITIPACNIVGRF